MLKNLRHSARYFFGYALALFTLGDLQHSEAAFIFVSNTTGDDDRSVEQATSVDTPFRTIQHAADSATPGDYVYVLPGIYGEFVRIRKSGLPGKPITFFAAHWGIVKLKGSIGGIGVRYINVLNFDVENSEIPTDPDTQNILEFNDPKGIFFYLCHHIRVLQNRVHDCRGGGISFGQSDQVEILDNLIYRTSSGVDTNNSGISIYQPYNAKVGRRSTFSYLILRNVCFNNFNSYFGHEMTDGHGILCDDYYRTQTFFEQYLPFYEYEIEINGVGEFAVVQSEMDFQIPFYGRTLIENNLCYANGGAGISTYLSGAVIIRNNSLIQNQQNIYDLGEIAILDGSQIGVINNLMIAPFRESSMSLDGTPDQRRAAFATSTIGAFQPDQLCYNSAICDSLSMIGSHMGNTPGIAYQPGTVVFTNVPTSIDYTTGNIAIGTGGKLVDAGRAQPNVSMFDLGYSWRVQGRRIDIGAFERSDIFTPSWLNFFTVTRLFSGTDSLTPKFYMR